MTLVHSDESADLFESDENSRDVTEVDEEFASNRREFPPECEASFWDDEIHPQEQASGPNLHSRSPRSGGNEGCRPEECPKPSGSSVQFRPKSPTEAKTSSECPSARQCDDEMQKRLDASLSRMQEDGPSGLRSFHRYMQLKKDKLRYQVNVLDRPANIASNIFQGISIFVNGYTDPSALELRQLIQAHGGEYHCYYEHGVTTYTIATSLASAKVSKTRREEKFVKPEWIVDCIAAGKLLKVDEYLLLSTQKKGSISAALGKKADTDAGGSEPRILDARDPNFLEEFYARSRLHLISTLAQEMKDYVQSMRSDDAHSFTGLDTLRHLMSDSYVPSTTRTIFHVDLDCFFVSVALRDRPDLVDKPVAVTHSKGVSKGFSELASVSYAARKYGVKNGMFVRDAIKLCPQLICLPYLFDDYRIIAKTIYTVVARYTLDIKAVSCDEMYIDCTNLFNDVRFLKHRVPLAQQR
ncbi:hypothetical protein KIN20_005204 [Parelaphostrongylus tenuis]|uniref:DNA repair protein REV1 n=1 Tax=Parelaphostrongylus tenuis TaxID=148309 RepID=A0AAD5M1T2_PARTN|nr:hypothetical protein KIN20_005204 [Parelaphostrongylus tenuis]